jgi:hypothetical protein
MVDRGSLADSGSHRRSARNAHRARRDGRCRDCRSKDVWERLENATFDGQPIAKGSVVVLTMKFSDDDRVVEMCFNASKRCERLKRG